eukprot:352556-Chlamydomonas_euryale.AAC.2
MQLLRQPHLHVSNGGISCAAADSSFNLNLQQPSLAARMGKSCLMLRMRAGLRVHMTMQGSRKLMPNPYLAGIATSSGTSHACASTLTATAGMALRNSSGSCHCPSHHPHRYRQMGRHRHHGRRRLAAPASRLARHMPARYMRHPAKQLHACRAHNRSRRISMPAAQSSRAGCSRRDLS